MSRSLPAQIRIFILLAAIGGVCVPAGWAASVALDKQDAREVKGSDPQTSKSFSFFSWFGKQDGVYSFFGPVLRYDSKNGDFSFLPFYYQRGWQGAGDKRTVSLLYYHSQTGDTRKWIFPPLCYVRRQGENDYYKLYLNTLWIHEGEREFEGIFPFYWQTPNSWVLFPFLWKFERGFGVFPLYGDGVTPAPDSNAVSTKTVAAAVKPPVEPPIEPPQPVVEPQETPSTAVLSIEALGVHAPTFNLQLSGGTSSSASQEKRP
ncbi:MAG: hypothetical protein NTX50_19050, partial [Candidatus Sumerlaeota bacterium]|nr:hypothetical protein [Candidatus Sumerlaeota bacterium]